MTLTRALQVLASVYTLDRRDGTFAIQIIADPWLAARVSMADFREAWAVVRHHGDFGAGDGSLPGALIRDVVAHHYGISLNEIVGRTHLRAHAHPRHIAMFICADYAGLTTVATAKLFGNRDHSTVVHALDRIRKLKATDSAFAAELATVIRQCQEEFDETSTSVEAARTSAECGEVASAAE